MVGICGTPGTGKKTVAPKVAVLLDLPGAVSINSFAPKGAGEVDPKQLRGALLRSKPPRVVLFGHLLPYVLGRREAALVAVLRCDPAVLRERLVARGYPPERVTENVEAELIGVLLYECVKKYGERLVREYDTTTARPDSIARAIAKDVEAGPVEDTRATPRWIDWTLDYGSSTKLKSLLSGGREAPAST